jgi:site-specific recombinase XerD
MSVDVEGVLRSAGVRDGFPFVLGEDGRYDSRLNLVLGHLPRWGLRSVNSVRVYGEIVVAFSRFLDEHRGGKSLWSTDEEDLQALWVVRRRDPATAVSPASWNLWVAALDKVFTVGVDLGLMVSNPFRRRRVRRLLATGVVESETNAAYEAVSDRRAPKFLTIDEYQRWFAAGVRRPGAAGERDQRLVELMTLTGLRAQETRSVLVGEIGPLDRVGPFTFNVGAMSTKTDRSHPVVLPARWRSDLAVWVHVYRRGIVARGRARGVYDGEGWLRVERVESDGVYLVGRARRTSYHVFSSGDRARLLLVDDAGGPVEPLALWLTLDGRPLTKSALEEVFRSAGRRCGLAGVEVSWVHPHMLRHTFAVHMLGLLVKQVVGAVMAPAARLGGIEPGSVLYTRAIADPLRRLQLMLGHASVASTERYLTCLDYAQEIVDDALADAEGLFCDSVAGAR